MDESTEDAIEQILLLAARHNILAIVITDDNPRMRLMAPECIEVVGRVRGSPIEGSDRLAYRTLFLEVHFRDETLWAPADSWGRDRCEN